MSAPGSDFSAPALAEASQILLSVISRPKAIRVPWRDIAGETPPSLRTRVGEAPSVALMRQRLSITLLAYCENTRSRPPAVHAGTLNVPDLLSRTGVAAASRPALSERA